MREEDCILLGCVNTLASLIAIDLKKKEAFWYCPANILRVCGICYFDNSLFVASDNDLTKVNATGIHKTKIPGIYDNYAHSVKLFDESQLIIADTGNSCIHLFDGQNFNLSLSPLESWPTRPIDAIHLNDALPFEGGFLVSAFSYQPFTAWKKTSYDWRRAGWGCLYHLQRFEHQTVSRIVSSGLECPHSLTAYQGEIYACASAAGDFISFARQPNGLLTEKKRFHISDSHFLRGAMRYHDGWLLGGSSIRHGGGALGMQLYYLKDDGNCELFWQGGSGEIYDIIA